MNQQSWSLASGSRGFVFSLDAVLAITIAMLLIAASVYVAKIGSDSLAGMHVARIGDDIAAFLDSANIFDTLNRNAIESSMDSMVPASYAMKVELNCTTRVIETSKQPPGDRPVFGGSRFVVTNNLDYCIARYWVWQE